MFGRSILFVIAPLIGVATFQALAAELGHDQATRKKIVFIAGPCEHSPGSHEAEAGARVMKYCLDHAAGRQTTAFYLAQRPWCSRAICFRPNESLSETARWLS